MTKALLVVDVQPAFDTHCHYVARRVAQRINNTAKPVVVLWVGEGLTDDTEDSVRDYLRAHGARPGRLGLARFVEKDFGFFRPWMDWGVAPEHIVTVGKALLAAPGGNTSESLDLEELLGDVPVPSSPLFWPSFDDRRLTHLSTFETCGGANQECLAEVELWLQMQGKPFKRLDHLVYG